MVVVVVPWQWYSGSGGSFESLLMHPVYSA